MCLRRVSSMSLRRVSSICLRRVSSMCLRRVSSMSLRRASSMSLRRVSSMCLRRASSMSLQEPSNKRVKPVGKGGGVTGIITPVKTPALKRLGKSITRSISFRTEARPLPPAPIRSRQKASSFPRRRSSQCWSDTVESHDLTAKEIKRQEVRGYC
uniref:Uncharacterized protein n=1 Tax=Hucho hucho TaxID=62062 RepID=A0A4W5LXB9_9TELE